jgi:ADP-ribose pyrophosphatase YjhB (NUDIX family)
VTSRHEDGPAVEDRADHGSRAGSSAPLRASGLRRHDSAVGDAGETVHEVPRVPASAGALLFDAQGRLLVLKPSYKRGWTIPGGQLEEDGETPWEACRRETREECGIEIAAGRLVCVDFRPPKPPGRPGGLRFLFDCGELNTEQLEGISLQAGEILECRLVELDEAARLLSGPVRRRVLAAVGTDRCLYLEDGRPVDSVRA